MNILATEYMGLNLNNPVILGSCPISMDIMKLKEIEKSGISAVVLKSLFEEELKAQLIGGVKFEHPESFEYYLAEQDFKYSPTKYLEYIREVKMALDIPVIASINCIGSKWWIDYAKGIEEYGADGLELNISYYYFNKDDNARNIEQKYIELVYSIKKIVDIPVAVKIGYNFTSIPNLVNQLKGAGADGVVLFNRYYKCGINLESVNLEPVLLMSTKEEAYEVLRWVGIISSQINIDIAAATGIKDENMILQMILAGASAVHIVSSVYEKGFPFIKRLIYKLEKLFESKGYDSIKKIKGDVFKNRQNLELLERVQYYKYTSGKFIT
jgi:dihydroorotate dehydrogenase (fumarate)